jgi:Domain of unknown function (DUF4832)/Beta-galactosidase
VIQVKRRSFLQLFSSSALLALSGRAGAQGVEPARRGGAGVQPSMRTITPTEIDGPLPNPFMGFGIWVAPRQLGYTKPDYSIASNTTEFGDDAPLFSWVMVDWDWAHLEPKEGQYDWEAFDAAIEYWASRGKHFIVRLWVTSDPGWKTDASPVSVIPEWLWQKGLKYTEYQVSDSADISSPIKQHGPDYLDPSYEAIYLPALQRLLNAFAGRYDKPDTPVIFVQIVGYGEWVDYATWFSKYRWPDEQIKYLFFSRLVNLFADTFQHIQLLQAYMGDWDKSKDWPVEKYLHDQAIDLAITKGAGLIDTGFIVARGWSPWTRQIVDRYWMTLPFSGEGWAYEEIKDVGTYGTIEENVKIVQQYHTNFYHFYSHAQSYRRMIRDDQAAIETGLRSGGLGYRLVLASASWPKEVPAGHLLLFDQEWRNRNVGRLYVHHPLKVCLLDSQGNESFNNLDWDIDVTRWVRGENYSRTSVIQLPEKLAAGDYEIRIALADPAGKPRIKLAIEGLDSAGRYKLGSVRILQGKV